jgi:hypothetical protein
LRGSTPAILNLKVFIGIHYPARPFLRNPFLKPCVQTRNHASPSTVLISNFSVSCAGSFLAAFISLCTYIRTTTTLFQEHSLRICSQKNALTDGWVVNEIQTEIFANPNAHTNPRVRF